MWREPGQVKHSPSARGTGKAGAAAAGWVREARCCRDLSSTQLPLQPRSCSAQQLIQNLPHSPLVIYPAHPRQAAPGEALQQQLMAPGTHRAPPPHQHCAPVLPVRQLNPLESLGSHNRVPKGLFRHRHPPAGCACRESALKDLTLTLSKPFPLWHAPMAQKGRWGLHHLLPNLGHLPPSQQENTESCTLWG